MFNSAFFQNMMQQQQNPFASPMGGGMPQNMSPQINIQQRPQGGMMPAAQPQQQQPGMQQTGGLQGAVNTGTNINKLYNMGNSTYDWGKDLFNGQQTPPMGANPNAAMGTPVSNNAAGNAYLQQNPALMMPGSSAQGGAAPMFGSSGPSGSASLYGTPNGGMFGSMGANGSGATAGGAGSFFGGASASGSAAGEGAAGSSAASSSPSWLQQLWAFL